MRRELLHIMSIPLIHRTLKLHPQLVTLLLCNLKWLGVDWFKVFETNFDVKSPKHNNLLTAYYFKAFMLEEWEIRTYATIPSPLYYPYANYFGPQPTTNLIITDTWMWGQLLKTNTSYFSSSSHLCLTIPMYIHVYIIIYWFWTHGQFSFCVHGESYLYKALLYNQFHHQGTHAFSSISYWWTELHNFLRRFWGDFTSTFYRLKMMRLTRLISQRWCRFFELRLWRIGSVQWRSSPGADLGRWYFAQGHDQHRKRGCNYDQHNRREPPVDDAPILSGHECPEVLLPSEGGDECCVFRARLVSAWRLRQHHPQQHGERDAHDRHWARRRELAESDHDEFHGRHGIHLHPQHQAIGDGGLFVAKLGAWESLHLQLGAQKVFPGYVSPVHTGGPNLDSCGEIGSWVSSSLQVCMLQLSAEEGDLDLHGQTDSKLL